MPSLARSIVLVVLLAWLAGCAPSPTAGTPSPATASPAQASATQPPAKKRVAALFSGLVTDQAWNQAGFEGLKQAEKEGVEILYTERVAQSEQLEVFRNYARQGVNVVIGHGGEFADAIQQAAKEFPNVQFVLINGKQAGGNLTSLQLNYFDQGYLAGVLAAGLSKSKKVAMVGGQSIPIMDDSEQGFRAGVKRAAPDAEVKVTITGDWEDVDKAREASLALINSGVDVLWHVLDAAGAGVLAAAEDRGVMAIGLISDQSKLAPKAHVGAVKVDLSKVMYRAATQPLDGQVHVEGVATGVVDLTALSPNIPQSVLDQINAAKSDLASGKVKMS